jgi:hypothetical protein
MNKFLLSLWLVGAVLYTCNAIGSPRSECPTGGTEVTLHVSPPPKTVSLPQAEATPGFEEVKLLVPRNLMMTGAVEGQAAKTKQPKGKAPAPMSPGPMRRSQTVNR